MLALFLVATTVGGPSDAIAQRQAYTQAQQQAPTTQPQDRSSMGLPDWAEPSKPSTRAPLGPAQERPVIDDAPITDPPEQLPVDGGLSLLALAGAGYAARKLRQGNDEDEADRDDVA